MHSSVRWSAKRRALLALLIPLWGGLSWNGFTSSRGSPTVGWMTLAAAVAALLLQVHTAYYRVDTSRAGITERWLWKRVQVSWNDVLQIDAIGQAATSAGIQRWSSSVEEAFHLVVHTRQGRISVHRWMTGVDDFIEVLRVARSEVAYRETDQAVLERTDATVRPAFVDDHRSRTITRVAGGVALARALFLAVVLTWLVGIFAAALTGFRLVDNPFVDGTLLAMLPWALGWLVYKLVARARATRFGAHLARPPLGATDLLLTLAASIGGPISLWLGVSMLRERLDGYGAFVLILGVGMCWFPIAQTRKQLREP